MTPGMTRYLATLALAITAALLTSQNAKAEKVLVYREGQLVNPQEVAAVLGRTRSISLLDDEPAPRTKSPIVTAVAPPRAPAAPSRPAARPTGEPKADASAFSLPVRFAFDSADILAAARPQLDAVAEGIKLLAPERTVTIEGHTSADGDEAYNLGLSQARAQAVREYLVQHHGIEAARLKTVAFGESRPIEGSDPNAAVNRRVQFRGT